MESASHDFKADIMTTLTDRRDNILLVTERSGIPAEGEMAPMKSMKRNTKWATVWTKQHDSYDMVNGCEHRSRKVTHLEKPSEQYPRNSWGSINVWVTVVLEFKNTHSAGRSDAGCGDARL